MHWKLVRCNGARAPTPKKRATTANTEKQDSNQNQGHDEDENDELELVLAIAVKKMHDVHAHLDHHGHVGAARLRDSVGIIRNPS